MMPSVPNAAIRTAVMTCHKLPGKDRPSHGVITRRLHKKTLRFELCPKNALIVLAACAYRSPQLRTVKFKRLSVCLLIEVNAMYAPEGHRLRLVLRWVLYIVVVGPAGISLLITSAVLVFGLSCQPPPLGRAIAREAFLWAVLLQAVTSVVTGVIVARFVPDLVDAQASVTRSD
jgi:hypothetical protein